MDYPINAKAIEIIDKYMKAGELLDLGNERFCMGTFKDMCEEVFRKKCVMRLVHRKGEKDAWQKLFKLFKWNGG